MRTSRSSYVARNLVLKNLLRASHLELPDCSCPAKRNRPITWFVSVKMSDVLMRVINQGPGYSFFFAFIDIRCTLDLWICCVLGYILFCTHIVSFVFFISSDTVSCLARSLDRKSVV